VSTKNLIADRIRRLCADRGLPCHELTDDTPLLDGGLGLDSLDMATLVAELERELGKDPFAVEIPSFRTFGDFLALYD
jgi:acyl carrier protein